MWCKVNSLCLFLHYIVIFLGTLPVDVGGFSFESRKSLCFLLWFMCVIVWLCSRHIGSSCLDICVVCWGKKRILYFLTKKIRTVYKVILRAIFLSPSSTHYNLSSYSNRELQLFCMITIQAR